MTKELAEKISTEIYDNVKKYGYLSMIEIDKIFKDNGFDYKGDNGFGLNESIVFWEGWNEEAFKIFCQAIDKGLCCRRASKQIYLADDDDFPDLSIFDLPIAKNDRDTDQRYWFSIKVCLRNNL